MGHYTNNLNVNNELTIEAWVKVQGNKNMYRSIIMKRGGGGGKPTKGWMLYAGDNNKWQFWLSDGYSGWSKLHTNVDVELNKWIYIVATYSNGKASIYINGELKNSSSIAKTVLNSDKPVRIGAGVTESETAKLFFNGLIDEVKIYDKALIEDEIKKHYEETKPVQPPVSYWKFNEGTGTAAKDSADANHGTVKRASWQSNCISGSCLSFDGRDDYVVAPYNANLDFKRAVQNFTLAAWINLRNLNSDEGIVGRWHESGIQQYILKFESDDKSIKFAVYSDGFKIAKSSANSITKDSWHYVVGIADSGTLKVYIDGLPSGTTASYGTIKDIGKTEGIEIGVDNGGTSNSEWFNGSIDEVKVYNKSLTADEIKRHYEELKPVEGYLQVATIKDTYKIGEKVELTDPPEEKNVVEARMSNYEIDSIGKKISEGGLYTGVVPDVEEVKKLPQYVPGEILIRFKKDPEIKKTFFISRWLLGKEKVSTNIESISKLNKQYKIDDFEKVLKIKPGDKKIIEKTANLYKLKTKSEENLTKIIEEYKKDPAVEHAQPNYLYYTSLAPNDLLYGEQWSHKKTHAEQAWDIEQGSSDVVIAIIDTGVDYNHEDLAGNIWHDKDGNSGYDFVDIDFEKEYRPYGLELSEGEDYTTPDNDPSDFNGHGTHCAGIAAAIGNNNKGVIGVCPKCKIMPVRAGFSIIYYGSVYGSLESDDIANAIYYAADNDADIISMSFGGGMGDEEKKALDYAYNKGVILIAAAGNSDTDQLSYPAGYDSVIAVAATDQSDYKAYFSNYGYWVDVAAPGVDILSTSIKSGSWYDPSGYMKMSGTSMATPYVAGLAGLIRSKNPDLTNEEVRKFLKQGIDSPFSEVYIGTGRVNTYKTIQKGPLSDITTEITSPKNNEIISERVDITGTAMGDDYEVLYGKGIYPKEWYKVGSGNVVQGSILANFDSSIVEDGTYTLKLVVNIHNEEIEDYRNIKINNIEIVSPSEEEIIGKGDNTISIIGSVIGTDFESYTIEFSNSENFVGWSSEGIILKDGGTKPIKDGVLATWDINKVETFPVDILKLTVSYKSRVSQEYYNIFVDSRIEEGWPRRIENWGSEMLNSARPYAPTIVDIDGDDNKEIILSSTSDDGTYGYLYVFEHNGETPKGWPKMLNCLFAQNGVTVADVNGDSKNEILSGCTQSPLFLFDEKGTLLNTFYFDSSLHALADMDNDGINDIIAIGTTIIAVLNSDGNNVVGWPAHLEYGEYAGGLAIGDITLDGINEVVVLTTNKLKVLKNDGSLLFEKDLKTLFDSEITGSGSSPSPVLGDIDNDGELEIVLGIHNQNEIDFIVIFESDGEIKNGWPIQLGESYSGVSEITLSNLDNDESPEIILGRGTKEDYARKVELKVLKNDGSLLFEKDFFPYISIGGSAVGDINDDGRNEIIFPVTKNGVDKTVIKILSNKGEILSELMVPGVYTWFDPPALSDLDNDGRMELIYSGLGEYIFVWDLKDSVFKGNNIEWTMPLYDPQHTSCYNCEETQPKPFIKSMINNTGTKTISGRLIIKVEKKAGTGLTQIKTVVDKQVSIEAGKYLALDKEWAAAGYFTPTEAGEYFVYAVLLNEQGVIETPAGKLESSYEFKVV